MKKFLAVFAVAAFLTACGGNSTTETTDTDSTSVTTVDTTTVPAVDTSHTMSADTTQMSTDSVK
jgi:hypothetical protein